MKLRILLSTLLLLVLSGCQTTRALSASAWVVPSAPDAKGKNVSSQLYVTYWEGSCWRFGCYGGDVHLRRCRVNDDDTVTCVDETSADKVLNQD